MKKLILIFVFIASNGIAFAANDLIALVIGNSKYAELGTLSNTINDARSINKSLMEMGYKTKLILDATESSLRRDVRNFAAESDGASIAIVYYAGHGGQVNGENYLLPVDIDIPKRESDIQLSSLKVDDIINSLRSKTKVVFLDACRDNPALIRSLSKGRGSYRGGLAPANSSSISNQSSGIFIAYATDAGNVALDGAGQMNSPFTSALLKYIKQPVSIDDMFSLVTREVKEQTKNSQKPYKYASLDGVICLPGKCGLPSQYINTKIDEKNSLNLSKNYKGDISLVANWVLFNTTLQPRQLIYIQPSSIKKVGNRVTVKTLWKPESEDTSFPFLNQDKKLTRIDYYVLDCTEGKGNIYQSEELDNSGNTLRDLKFGSPQFTELKSEYISTKGSVGDSLFQLSCNPDKNNPLISKEALESDDWERLYTLDFEKGVDFFYLKSSLVKKDDVVDVIVKLRNVKPTSMSEYKGSGFDSFKGTPYIKDIVALDRIDCKKRTLQPRLQNGFGENGDLLSYPLYLDSQMVIEPITDKRFEEFLYIICKG